jgi:hypothetical protein
MSDQISNLSTSLKSPQSVDLSVPHPRRLIPAISRMQPPRETTARLLYCGSNWDGRFRLQINGEKFFVSGAIYALSQSTDHNGKSVWLKLLLDMTPGYHITKNDELSFDVICAVTGARMLVMGQVRPFVKDAQTAGGTYV